jgi:hypothetical protein
MNEQVSRASLFVAVAGNTQRKDSVRLTKANWSVESLLMLSSVVELNLRLPSMLHGKKGFERIVWAFKNVLTQPMAWLFHDLESKPAGDYAPKLRETEQPNLPKRLSRNHANSKASPTVDNM